MQLQEVTQTEAAVDLRIGFAHWRAYRQPFIVGLHRSGAKAKEITLVFTVVLRSGSQGGVSDFMIVPHRDKWCGGAERL